MDCVNHPGVSAAGYCQNCGKPMCTACVRREPTGQVMCEPCWTAWHAAQPPYAPPAAPFSGRCPSPFIAGALGFIPGVGAMFNGQFLKGFVHVIIFAVLASMAEAYSMFGWLIVGWIFYQVFDAFQTAKAKCEGQPLPDPLGINELVSWFGREYRRSHGMPQPPAAGPVAPPPPPPAEPAPAQATNPYQSGYQPPPFTSFGGAPPVAGFAPGYPPPPNAGYPPPPPAGYPPPVPVPPYHYRRREPIAAIILIAMGVLFLLGQFSWHAMHYAWPVLLIGLGAWLFVRRMQDVRSVPPPMAPPQSNAAENNGPRWEETRPQEKSDDPDQHGGAQ